MKAGSFIRRGIGLGAVILLTSPVMGNHLVITNVVITNVISGEADIQFDMSWDNSWRTSWSDNGGSVTVTNWDAVWVFAKFRQSGSLWKHLNLTTNGHTATGGTVIEVADDGGDQRLGAFVYRPGEGSGSVTCTAMRLHWDYAASGLSGTTEVDVAVFGIEMVYIPEGSYSLGSGPGGTEGNHFYRYPNQGDPYVVSNSADIIVGTSTGNLYYAGGDHGSPIPASYPNGYDAVYCMKYEITQGQYTDYLNLLDPTVATLRFPNKYGQNRNTIADTGTVYTVEAPDRACNWIREIQIYQYLDWCGLRPMTGLEFEKICRGPRTPWANEYAWGDTTYVEQVGHSGTDGSGSETATPTNANIHMNSAIPGPVRVGIFATGTSSRHESGASYYGVMDMSGNLMEMIINPTRAPGRAFIDVYGDGNEYTAYPATWPSAGPNSAVGGRGGGVSSGASSARVSERGLADYWSSLYNTPAYSRGGRGVRTAP